ncbi:hypothetical protein BGZ60DRAFT_529697 [Tricladium varicosporioides]|nr:hypothetical protein BGZ60DRAFT_529697 [Hymenoscyphus varicosporioides]
MFDKLVLVFAICSGVVSALPSPASESQPVRRDISGTSNVYFGENTGEVKNWASGILLGLPLNPDQIPFHWLGDIGFWNMRSGGSQLAAPSRGWTYGYDEFMGRYASLKADYEVTRQHGGNFQIMIHDLWGTDTWPSFEATPMPGDNGSYESFDKFLDTLFALLIQDGIVENVWWDLWNEVDNVDFLNRGLDRWLEYWGHAYHKIMRDFPNAKTTGPSYGHLPNFAGPVENYFSGWANFVAANNSFPEKPSLHFLYPNGDLTTSINSWNTFLNAAGINYQGTWNVQEYGAPDQQIPSTAVWNIAQLERHNAWGLRANWRGGLELHDLLANLLGKSGHEPNYNVSDVNYWPAREYPVYLYYHQKMKGYRVRTEMTEDTLGDSFVTVDPAERRVRILFGCRPYTGVWNIGLNQLTSLGLPASGELFVTTWRFNSAPSIYDEVSGPDFIGEWSHTYTNGELILPVYQVDPSITWAFEFSY